MTELDPKTFDLDAWLSDAHLPERSVTVYQKPHLIAELERLQRLIDVERQAADVERSLADSPRKLEAEWEALAQEFSDSGLTVFVRATTSDEQRQIGEQFPALGKDAKDAEVLERNKAYGAAVLAAAIIAVQPAGGERVSVSFAPEKVRALNAKIGDAQAGMIHEAWLAACRNQPQVDADFLSRSSSRDAGRE